MSRIETSSPGHDTLSDRERSVAEKFAAGLTYREIGEALFIAPSTVRTHLASIYDKLGVRNKVALASHVNGAIGAGVDGLPPLPEVPPCSPCSPSNA
ncbi:MULTISPECIES: helix-turn-helix transcriptional regulator [unclassified Mesorhizobium]|uniref:helix-turn-helix domain-containing protein n=1 Tax=unclassified Mesorhizobium TaxID=325217 RepID=UPI001FE1B150|nr:MULTISPECIES: helix-turn-helix transcriptional regulator [unclassified Mesorhizobium]